VFAPFRVILYRHCTLQYHQGAWQLARPDVLRSLLSLIGAQVSKGRKKAERNANELRRADHEVHDIADGRYDGRIQKFQQGLSR